MVLNLYVIGTISGLPSAWSKWDEFVLVYAATGVQAQHIAEDFRPVHPVIPEHGVIFVDSKPIFIDSDLN